MYVLIWATLLFSVRGNNVDRGASVGGRQQCLYYQPDYCITLPDGEIRAEAGLSVVIPCSFTTAYSFTPQSLVWYKCESTEPRCGDSDTIFDTDTNNINVQSEFKGRVTLLEPDVSQKTCSIIINDLKESDSGSYQLRVNGERNRRQDGLTFYPRATLSVKAKHHSTEVTPKVSFKGDVTTEETVTMNMTLNQGVTTCQGKIHCLGSCAALLLAITGVSLGVNVFCIVCIFFLWNARKKMKPNEEDRMYMSLKKTDRSAEYDVIAQPLH